MLEDMNGELGGLDGRERRQRRVENRERQLADREVPLGSPETEEHVLAPSVQAWLDGELPEATVRKGATSRDVEFWKRLNSEVESRRRVRTPAHLEAQIMEALPQTLPAVITPWWRREFVVTPVAAVSTAAALMAVSALLTAMVVATR